MHSNNHLHLRRYLRRYQRRAGFSLIELIVAMAIISILVSIALPSYQNYILRANRSEGRAALTAIAARMERGYSASRSYAAPANLSSQTGLYNIAVSNLGTTGQSFTLTATPTFVDLGCGSLTLTNLGVRSTVKSTPTPTLTDNECWGK